MVGREPPGDLRRHRRQAVGKLFKLFKRISDLLEQIRNRYMSRITVVLACIGLAIVVAFPAQGSILVNGDFESGNMGFQSDYAYHAGVAPPNLDLAQYTVNSNPHNVHQAWVSFGDHTTGHGQMLLVNGAMDATKVVWSEAVTLIAGATYRFSAWATGVYYAAPGDLNFSVNGTQLGTLSLSSTVPDWKQFTSTFVATASAVKVAAVRDLQTAYNGNDFAMDDISLVMISDPSSVVIPEPATVVIWSLLGCCVAGFAAWRRIGRRTNV